MDQVTLHLPVSDVLMIGVCLCVPVFLWSWMLLPEQGPALPVRCYLVLRCQRKC